MSWFTKRPEWRDLAVDLSARNTCFALFQLGLAGLMAGRLRALVEYSISGDRVAASHIILVPFVTAALLYMNRQRIFETVNVSVVPGLLVAAAGIGVLSAYEEFGVAEADRLTLVAAGIVVIWLGGFLFFYGGAAFRRGLFPLLFLALAIPIPTLVLENATAVLQRGSAETAYLLLKLTGTPVYREGFVFAMPGLTIEIAPECSGIRSGIGMFIVGLLAGNMFLRTWWKRSALVFAALIIGILKNAIRIDTLSLLTIHVDPGIINGRLHHEGGIVFFALGLLLVYPVLAALVRSERAPYLQDKQFQWREVR